MDNEKVIKLGKDEEFIEDIREHDTRCPKCGGVLITNSKVGISVEFCVEGCGYENYDYDL